MQIPSLLDTFRTVNQTADRMGFTLQTKIICVALTAIGTYVAYKITASVVRSTLKAVLIIGLILLFAIIAISISSLKN
jgi:hypothetical protein